MISTGVASLDERLNGLRPGGLYAIAGPRSSGKSVLGLHFLADGLSRDERCVLITSDEPAMIESRAAFIGYTGAPLAAHRSLQILSFPERAEEPSSVALGQGLGLAARLRWLRPARIVVDGLERSADYRRSPHRLSQELARLVEETGATAYVLLQANAIGEQASVFQPVLERATAIFRLDLADAGERTLHFHRQPPDELRAEPISFVLRVGAGFTEEVPLRTRDLTPEQRRRVLLLDELGVITPELLALLEKSYEVKPLRSTAGMLGVLAAGQYGLLLMSVDPFDHGRATDLMFTLRRSGNAVPVICVAPSRGLRSTTRSRCLQSGADDFFIADMPASEMAERIQTAWLRGAHPRGGLNQIGHIVQPTGSDGAYRLMTESELTQALDTLLGEQPPLFFCYVEFRLAAGTAQVVWPLIRTRLRVGDGDIVGLVSGNRLVCVLDRITAEQTARVLTRIRMAHPALGVMREVRVIGSPAEVGEIKERVASMQEQIRPLTTEVV